MALMQLIDLFLHLDAHLANMAAWMGPWLYFTLFMVIFCETGLVVTPFLPGDSLLFAVGALVAIPSSGLNLGLMAALLVVAAILGDAVNYSIGARVGSSVFKQGSRWLKKEHLERTHEFYETYGGKTILFARFIPIVRTFAPFVAGIGTMSYRRFAFYNVSGALAWVGGFLGAGYYLGNLPSVKSNFHIVIFGIIIVSALPAVIEVLRARRKGTASQSIPPVG